MFNKKSLATLLILFLMVVAFQTGNTGTGANGHPPYATLGLDNQTHIDINKIDMIVTNYAAFGQDFVGSQGYGTWFPKGSDLSPLFAGGIFVGGYVNGDLRVTACDHGSEFIPGSWQGRFFDGTEDGNDPYPDKPYYKIYKINKTDGPGDAAYDEWIQGHNDAIAAGDPNAAPPLDVDDIDGDGVTDEPLVYGDQTLWSIFNDSDVASHTGVGNTDPIGLEIRSTTFAFDREGALGHIIFTKLEIENVSQDTLKEAYVSVWADPDLGTSGDDLVGCDKDLSLGFCYNASNNDGEYGAAPPAMGYDFFQGPVGDDGEILGMSSFNKYINGTDPDNGAESYDYMLGLDGKTGNPVLDPNTGEPSPFYAPGDPVKGVGWLDSNPADRRFMQNAGPFTFEPGEVQEVVIAIIVARGGSNLGSVDLLKYYDTQAQYAFDVDFKLPFAPDQPVVDLVEEDGAITLSWGNESYSEDDLRPPSEVYPRQEHNADDYAFEGYAIYQGVTELGPWTLLATYDIGSNGKQWLWDRVYDTEAGALLWKPVVKGEDGGLRYQIRLDRDYINNDRLYNATPYYYSVTAYSYDTRYNGVIEPGPDDPVTPGLLVLESSKRSITAIPRTPSAGTDVDITNYDPEHMGDIEITYTQNDSEKPATTDQLYIDVVDPYLLTGDEYEIYWTAVDPIDELWEWVYEYDDEHNIIDSTWTFVRDIYPSTPSPPVAPENVKEYKDVWHLKNKTNGEILLSDQWNRFADIENRVIDGFRITLDGTYDPELANLPPNDWWIDSPEGENSGRCISWEDWGNDYFYGAIDYGSVWWDSNLDPVENADQFGTVQIVWTNKVWVPNIDSTNPNDHYAEVVGEPLGQNCYRYDRGGDNSYLFTGYLPQPFEVWEVVGGERVRQLNFLWVEWTDSGIYDDYYNPASYSWESPHDPPDAHVDRSYFFIMNSEYGDPVADGHYRNMNLAYWNGSLDVDNFDMLYGGQIQHRGSNIIDPGDAFQFTWGIPFTANDVYTFSTTPVVKDDLTLMKEELKNVKVVPNPYYGISTYETNQFKRLVKFTHLPATCTIRVFNLAGDKVRTLEKDDDTSMLEWDLYTDENLPVASGIYIYHVTAYEPGTQKEVSTKIGKMAIFMEKESLNVY